MPEATGLRRIDQHRGKMATALVLSLAKRDPLQSQLRHMQMLQLLHVGE